MWYPPGHPGPFLFRRRAEAYYIARRAGCTTEFHNTMVPVAFMHTRLLQKYKKVYVTVRVTANYAYHYIFQRSWKGLTVPLTS